MKIIQIIIYGLIFSLLNGGDETVEEILLTTYHRLDSINHQFTVHFKQTGKKQNNNYRVLLIGLKMVKYSEKHGLSPYSMTKRNLPLSGNIGFGMAENQKSGLLSL